MKYVQELMIYLIVSFLCEVDGMENATSFAFELDKPYTVQRDDEEEITVCSKGSSSSNPQEKDNVLHYRTEVPIRVRMKYQKLFEQAFEYKCFLSLVQMAY